MTNETNNSKRIDARIYSNVFRHNGSIYVGGEYMRAITDVRLIRTGGVFGNQLRVTHRNGSVHVIKQCDRRMFFIDGPNYDGECDGFTDGVRLLNGM